MSPTAATVDAIESAALRVTRELPEAHRLTRHLRQSGFRRAAQHLRDLVFRVDPIALTDEQFEELPRLIEVGIKALEIHMLASDDASELQAILADLRSALDGIECGLPADPAKRPSREDMARRAGERALEILLHEAS